MTAVGATAQLSARRRLGSTSLDVSPLCLGGNVFGWTADARTSFAVLDAYAAAGGNFIDTADRYSAWVPGHSGGESERVIGDWLASRGNRSDFVVATKVGYRPDGPDLSPDTIRTSVAASLRRLRTDRIDLLYAHIDDPARPLTQVLDTFGDLLASGTVRHIAASNFSSERLQEALALGEGGARPTFEVVQAHYNLVERASFEREYLPLLLSHGVPCLPYFGLAKGFLTGKYNDLTVSVASPRSAGWNGPATSAARYLGDARAMRVIDAVRRVAGEHETSCGAVALAWLLRRQGVAAVLASARTVGQLHALLPFAELALSADDIALLDAVSEPDG